MSENVTNLISTPATAQVDEDDLIVNMRNVSVVRDGRAILAPMDWQVELDERWIIVGPNGAGKTTLMRLASAQMFPTTGTVKLIGEQVGKVDLRELRTAIGMSSSARPSRARSNRELRNSSCSSVSGGGVDSLMEDSVGHRCRMALHKYVECCIDTL